ncbi:phospholipase D/Transphosphatidylase [Shewanella sp. ANA-3]|uniref:phospholipase D family protein n=1 Tax=Shewanella sp. (strain ANA-3) TaxID=94122 RepID=UPI00005E0D9C|nr:phospholipase D family protein [Shewanella sp. ANA-3]ABK47658.1 phospholipase D/Transphosphatidylase [Shewanella sp. ANA-3]
MTILGISSRNCGATFANTIAQHLAKEIGQQRKSYPVKQMVFRLSLPFWGLLLLLINGCSSMAELPAKSIETAYPLAENSTLYQAVKTAIAQHSEQTGVFPLGDGVDAFVARLLLIESAVSSIDLQYYIYRNDETGRLLTWFLLDAADRGVRVRLLLDDMTSADMDEQLIALARHPNINIRLFNPSTERNYRGLAMLFGFSRLNHRMHNKSFTVDNVMTIVGGRNIGDEYFAANRDLEFGDFDLLAMGDAVPKVSDEFDRYWNADTTHPIEVLSDHNPTHAELEALAQRVSEQREQSKSSEYVKRLAESQLLANLQSDSMTWFWGKALVLVDPPDKLQQGDKSTWLLSQLLPYLTQVESELLIISPYFVPTQSGTDLLTLLAQSGKRVRVITNSLAATDVLAVHAGYKQYRKTLLAAGVEIYEVKAQAGERSHSWHGSSKSSLHAKSFVFDNNQIFVGSFNFDPRSAAVNTELGLLITQPQLSGHVSHNIEEKLATNTYRLALEDGDLVWWDDGAQQRYDSEPDAGFWRIFVADFLGLLPIESQL